MTTYAYEIFFSAICFATEWNFYLNQDGQKV
jgi:hypothetical protein